MSSLKKISAFAAAALAAAGLFFANENTQTSTDTTSSVQGATLNAAFVSTPGDQQTFDTTIAGWHYRITWYTTRTDSSEAIGYFVGAGEVGSDFSLLNMYGPHYWLATGLWDGGVDLGNGRHYPILFSVQPPSQSVYTGTQMKAHIDPILARFKIKKRALYLTGPSAGGYAVWSFVTYQSSTGVHTGYGDQVTAIMCPEAVKPNQQQSGSATPAYPQNTVQWIQMDGKYALAFNQINDPTRDIPTYYKAMNDSMPHHVTYYNTTFEGGVHGGFDRFWNPMKVDWANDSIVAGSGGYNAQLGDGIPSGWNTYQWLLRKGDTSLASVVSPSVDAGADKTVPTTTSSVNFVATATPGSGGAILSYAWTQTAGSSLVMSGASTQTLTLTGPFSTGTRTFHVVVADAMGYTAADDVNFTAVDTSTAVSIFAGRDTTLPLSQTNGHGTHLQDTSQIVLQGSGSASIVSWLWTQLSGPSTLSFKDRSAAVTNSWGYVEGYYTLVLAGSTSSGVTIRDTIVIRAHDWQRHNVRPKRVGKGLGFHPAKTGTTSFIYQHLDKLYMDANGDGIVDTLSGGDTLYIPGGNYSIVDVSGWHGDVGDTLYICPYGSPVVVTGTSGTPRLRFGSGVDDSASLTYAKIDGSVLRSQGYYYGFIHDNPVYLSGAFGVSMNATSNVDIGFVYIHNVGVGWSWKNNSDSSMALQTFNMFRFKNGHIHDIQIHYTGTENFYIGHTSPCGCGTQAGLNDGQTVRGDSILIERVILDSSGYDGIQLSNFTFAKVTNNFMSNVAFKNEASQRAAFILGGNMNGEYSFNIVWGGKEGMIGTPNHDNYIHDNYIHSVRNGSTTLSASMSYSGAGPSTNLAVEYQDSATFKIYGNFIDSAEGYAIRIYTQAINFNKKVGSAVYGNYIADPTRSLSTLISSEFLSKDSIYNNQLVVGSFPIVFQNLSSITGPLIRATYKGSISKDFTEAQDAIAWAKFMILGGNPSPSLILRLKKPPKVKLSK